MWREYERTSTTIADAFVKPVVDAYVDGVGAAVGEHARSSRWNLVALERRPPVGADAAQRRPAQLLLSGLAGGVIGGRHFAARGRVRSAFTLDMGGTSCDIGVVQDGEQRYAREFDVAWGIPVTIPCVDVKTIGAGGGSIAWIDRGGLLRVGPQSAGAEPGPAAYARGGDGADPHRRQHRARAARAGLLPRGRDATSTPMRRSRPRRPRRAPRPRPRARPRARRWCDRRREHGQRDPPGRRRARHRPARASRSSRSAAPGRFTPAPWPRGSGSGPC